jgi:hypothetical protein
MLAACPECAALASDIELVSRATATSVVPGRPRDFRLSPEQASVARGGILDRLRRRMGAPGSSAVRPLAGAAVAMGLVLVLVAPSLRPAGSSGAGADADSLHASEPHATMAAKATVPAPEAAAGAADAFAPPATDEPTVESGMTMVRMAASPDATAAGETATNQDAASPAPDAQVAEAPPNDGQEPTDGAREARAGSPDDTTYALTLLGIVIAGVGLMVLLLSWLARRWQDPLLR